MLKIKHENHLCAYDVHLLTNLIVRCNPLIWFSLLSWRPKEQYWPQKHARILIFKADWVWWCPLLSSSYWNLLTFLVWHTYDSYMRKENTDTVASHHLFLFFPVYFIFLLICCKRNIKKIIFFTFFNIKGCCMLSFYLICM